MLSAFKDYLIQKAKKMKKGAEKRGPS